MADEQINTNVVLTADTSQYDQATIQSAQNTDNLGASVDSLSSKLERLAKGVGRKMVGIAAADVATVAGATAAYAAFEHQMSRLNAQSATLEKSMSGQTRTFDTYTRSVNSLRASFGTSTSEAAALNLQLAKMSDHTTSIQGLARTFTEMSNATGESAQQLTNSVLSLGRVMGTPQRDTQKYADALTSLASTSNTTASALADFSSQVAPVGRLLNMSQTDIMGVSKAFVSAGQDGYQAATAFNKIVSDIASATQSGSPDLAKYANLVGMTVEQFSNLGGSEKIIDIFDRLNTLGPKAITELNRMGLDGMRTMRALTAVSQQSGGIGASIREARDVVGDGSTSRASEASMKGMTDEFAKMRSEIMMTAESFGSTFAPAVEKVLQIGVKLTSMFRTLMDGPFGDFIKAIAAIVAPIASIGGGLLLMAGGLAKLSTAALIGRGSLVQGIKEGYRGGAPIVAQAGGGYGPMAGGALGVRGGMVAERGSWLQRGFYNAGARSGAAVSMLNRGSEGIFSRGAGLAMGGAGWGAGMVGRSVYSPLGWSGINDPTTRFRMFNNPTLGGSMGIPPGFMGIAGKTPGTGPGAAPATGKMPAPPTAAKITPPGTAGVTPGASTAAAKAATVATTAAARETTMLARGFQGLAMGTAVFGRSLASAAMGVARFTMSMVGSALMSPMGMMTMAMVGIPALMSLKSAHTDKSTAEYTDMSRSGSSYMQAAGLQPSPIWQPDVKDQQVTDQTARQISRTDVFAAKKSSHHLTDTRLKGMSADQVTSYLSTQWDQYKNDANARQQVKLDLIDKFDEVQAQEILSNLDTNKIPGIDSFISSKTDWDSMSKGDAGKRASAALGVIEDKASGAFATTGAAGAQQIRAGQYAQLLQNTLKNASASGTTDQGAGAFNVIAQQMFGGEVDFDRRGVRDLVQGKKGTRSNFGRYLETDAETKTPEGQAALLTQLAMTVQKTQGKAGVDATEKMLADFGASTTIDLTSQKEINTELLKVLKGENKVFGGEEGLDQRIALRQGGRVVTGSADLKYAADRPEDIDAQYQAINDIYSKTSAHSSDLLKQYGKLGDIQGEIGDNSDHSYQILDAIMQRQLQTVGMQQQFMSRPEAFQSQAKTVGAILDVNNPLSAGSKDQASQAFLGQAMDQAQYYKGLSLQIQQFSISRERAEQDFGIQRERMEVQYQLSRQRAEADFQTQRKYAEQDYDLSRQRAEEDFTLQKERGQEAFDRSMHRSQDDFALSRKRQEQDYNHQVVLMAEAAAKQIYNIYERVQVKRTNSAGYLLVNAQDQLQRMQKQASQLDQLRGMGLSNESIQQLGFNDSSNAQQLSRFVSEVTSNPQMIAQMNEAIKARLEAARALVTDESSSDWEEFNRQYTLSTSRAQQDFEKAMKRARQDYRIQLEQMNADFEKSMQRQADDFEKAMKRQSKAFDLSMSRAAEDYNRSVSQMADDFNKSMGRAQEDMDLMATTFSDNFNTIMDKAIAGLTGKAKQQAILVKQTFTDIGAIVGPEGVSLMEQMSQIFGFKYTAPKGTGASGAPHSGGGQNTGEVATGGMAEGGVLPGFTPGRDVHTFRSESGGTLHLSGGEAIMRPEWVRAMGGPAAIAQMNRAAKSGMAFKEGGVLPDTPVYMDGAKLAAIAAAQIMLAEKTFNKSYSVMQGGFGGNHYGPSGTSHNYPGVADIDQSGGGITFGDQTNLRKVGFAAWARNIPGAAYVGSGAHAHSVSMLSPGTASSPQLSSYAAGGDGMGGRDYGERPALMPNLMTALKGFTNLAVHMGTITSGLPLVSVESLLKQNYPNIEEAASKYKLGGGFPPGWWSRKFNKAARGAYNHYVMGKDPMKWNASGGIYSGAQTIGVGETGPEMVLPLNGTGANFMMDVMSKTQVGPEGRLTNTSGTSSPMAQKNLYQYQIDRSTTFSGDITVQANDPTAFLADMKARQALQALSQPVLARS